MKVAEKELDIIILTYYEQENITKVIEKIEKYVKTNHVISVIIQDQKDPTIPILNELKRRFKTIRIVMTNNEIGMLKALKVGFENSHAPIIVITMADLSDDARDIEGMVKKIKDGYDLVCGSRYCKGGKHLGGPFIKGFLSKMGCLTLKLFTGIPTSDATNAFKCFKKSIVEKISIESEQGFELPLEITVKAYKGGYRITEVPTTWRDRESGESKFKTWNNLRYYLRWYFFGICG